MTENELRQIISEELDSRPVWPPANPEAAMDLLYRELRFLPAKEIRLAIRAFYAAPICERCGTRSQRWPHPEEIRAQVPQGMVDRIAAERKDECSRCAGTGWMVFKTRDGQEAAVRCQCMYLAMRVATERPRAGRDQ